VKPNNNVEAEKEEYALSEIADLGIGWEWEYDADFVFTLDRFCQRAGLSSYLVHPHNLPETWERVQNGSLFFRTFLDRASDNVEAIRTLISSLKARGIPLINDPELLPRANDKATMHLELLAKGVHVPYTIIMGPQEGNHIQDVPELQSIGTPFIIKPANGGGGRGVILGAQGKVDVVRARKILWGDKMLLQEEILPAQLPVGMAWFRTFMVDQKIYLCWWNRETHIYRQVSPVEEAELGLGRLRSITKKIGEVCGLTLFSTEIAQSRDGRFVAVDYVNDQPDFRPRSKAPDGVPDPVLNEIVRDIVQWVKQYAREGTVQET
jgi:glutathione synthase/RimK-type ligase-like ATP-grasp enzyme